VGADPDAMWKPGYTGVVAYPARPTLRAAPPQARRRRPSPWWAASAAALVVAGGALAVIERSGGDVSAPAGSSAVARIPDHAVKRWAATVDGRVSSVIGTEDVVLATTSDPFPTITALAADTGAVLWTSPAQVVTDGPFGAVAGNAVFRANPPGRLPELVAFDVHTGEVVWRHPFPKIDAGWDVDARRVLVIRYDSRRNRTTGVDLLDPATGATRASIDGADILLGERTAQVRDGDTFEVYDLDTLTSIGRITVPSLHDRPARIVPTATGTVAVIDGKVLLLDGAGRITASAEIPAFDTSTAPDAWAVPGSGVVVIQAGDMAAAVTVGSGRVRVTWTRRVWVLDRRHVGKLVVVLAEHIWTAATPASNTPVYVIDAATGDDVWSGTIDTSMPADGILTANGFVANLRLPGESGRSVAIGGIDLRGHVRWRRIRDGVNLALVPRGVVEAGPTPGQPDRTTLTMLG
jgi:outer membrane protein assembly factor BamB